MLVLDKEDESYQNYQLACYLEPDDYKDRWDVWASKKLMNEGHGEFGKNLNAAIQLYNRALGINPQYGECYYWRGYAKYKLKRKDSAIEDFYNAVEYNPRDYKMYVNIDRILSKDKNWDTIIPFWNRFIEFEPNHAEAYLERAGTYYNKGDYLKSIEDLRVSCELGNKTACGRYNQLTSAM